MSFLNVNLKEVRSDLLLFENQIPLFFIQKVYDLLVSGMMKTKFPPFHVVLEPFLFFDMPWSFNHEAMSMKAAHLLDLYWKCSSPLFVPEQILPVQEQPSWVEMHISNNAPKLMCNATELHQKADIRFEKLIYEYSRDLRGVPTLNKKGIAVIFSKGILQMPCLKVDSCQTRLLVNLIAFENSMPLHLRSFSCYVKFLDALIDSEKDVELLQQYGVIFNTLTSHKMAAMFFNDIGNLCVVDNKVLFFNKLYEDVHKYCESISNQRMAILKQNYINSLWGVISLGAGGTLLILTVIQTFYTVFAYYHPR